MILKGLFSKWYCPECNTILKRRQVKYQHRETGHNYYTVWFMCLECGNKNGVKTLKETIIEMILDRGE